MWKQASLLALAVALAGCTGSSPNPVNGGDPGDGDNGGEDPGIPPIEEDVGIPADIAGDLENVAWDAGDPDDPTDDRLIVTGLTLDDAPVDGTYQRAPSEDLPGYMAFSKQDDRLDRIFVALAREAPDGSVRGVAASDGGQFDTFFGGVFFERTGELTRPDVTDENGLVSYGGAYAAVLNSGDAEQNLAEPVRPGDPPDAPRQPRTVEGKVFMNVDFSDNSVNGEVYDRRYGDTGEVVDDGLILIPGALAEDGTFEGEVRQRLPAEPPRGVGAYAGTLGGENASGMAGGLVASGHLPPDDPDNRSREFGTWVIPRCGAEGAPAFCEDLGDLE